MRKGQVVMIPILAIHRDKTIWGEDATEFRYASLIAQRNNLTLIQAREVGIDPRSCEHNARRVGQLTYVFGRPACLHRVPARAHGVSPKMRLLSELILLILFLCAPE
jgi:hypothetical protein